VARPVVQAAASAPARPMDCVSSTSDKHPERDAIARLLASGVVDHRLPNIPAQLAKTVDEIECVAPPAAN